MNTSPYRSKGGFSLVEITVAIGVIAFALVGLMGLLSASLNTGKASEDDTRYAAMSQQVLDMLRSGPFEEIPFEKSVTAFTTKKMPSVYFDNEGGWVGPDRVEWPNIEDGIVPREAVYKCSVFVDVDSETVSPPIPKQPNQPAEQRINLLRVHLAFTPPTRQVESMLEDVTAKDPIIHATIPRY